MLNEDTEVDTEAKPPRRRRWLWVLAGVAVLLFLVVPFWIISSKRAAPYAFLSNARVVQQQDWIEGGNTGPGRLKTNGEYLLSGSLEEVAASADSLLKIPGWKVDGRTKIAVKYSGGMSYVTLQNRPATHEVKIHVQSYRSPTFADRCRLWAHKVGLIR